MKFMIVSVGNLRGVPAIIHEEQKFLTNFKIRDHLNALYRPPGRKQ